MSPRHSRPAPVACLALALALPLMLPARQKVETDEPFVRMSSQELERSLKVGYAVLPVDVDQDGKKDLVVVDTTRVV